MFSAFQTFGRLGASASAAPFSPTKLFPAGASSPGLWIDPSYPASEFQDSAGTTALSTVGTVLDSSNPVGLVLDTKNGTPVLGPELVTNGDFSNGTTGWSVYGATLSVASGECSVTNNGINYGQVYRAIATVIGKTYRISATVRAVNVGYVSLRAETVLTVGNLCDQKTSSATNVTLTGVFVAVGTSTIIGCANTHTNNGVGVFDNISVREIPGIHLSQSTSAARPVASARVNLLTYSDALDTANWNKTGCTVSINSATSPSAAPGAVVFKVAEDASNGQHYFGSATTLNSVLGDNMPVVYQAYIKSDEYSTASFSMRRKDSSFLRVDFDLVAMTATPDASSTATITDAGGGWRLCRAVTDSKAGAGYVVPALAPKTIDSGQGVAGSGVLVCGFQVATLACNYQRVGAASDYTATGFPVYLKFDGTDDGLASATFSAGTLTSSMDCLIALRRDSADMAIVGLYTAQGSGNWFGLVLAGDGGVCFCGVGSPTVFVDGAQLTGGTSVTCGTLHTALTVGAWHIMEFRGMDMSAWTATLAGNYGVGYSLNGALGGIKLFASGQDANRDKARARMAAYFGVTLP